VEKYKSIIGVLSDLEIKMPVLAVGGIKIYDVNALMQSGIYGVAVSGAINFADDFIGAYQDFYDAVKG
ncbi:MAG: thiamine phosphate synthase, partial [Pedobacter sp.]